jgi:hypothetical protein
MTLLPNVRPARGSARPGCASRADLLRKAQAERLHSLTTKGRFAQTSRRAGFLPAAHPKRARASPCHRPAKESLMSKTMPDSRPAAVTAAA